MISINIIIGLFILFLLLRKNKNSDNIKSDVTTFENYKFDDSFSEYEKKLLVKIDEKFSKYLTNKISLDVFYAVLWQESGTQIFNDVTNDNVIGDKGNSIGYMQINKFGAYPEIKQRFNLNHTFDDLKDEATNIFYGQSYLNLCYQTAYSQSTNKPISWLVFKKYNGGLDETESSNNSLANSYADKTYQKFLKVSKFLNLNYN